jgi:exopolysaccharide biosynthesis polyprenyl glycosylphosphotransferase
VVSEARPIFYFAPTPGTNGSRDVAPSPAGDAPEPASQPCENLGAVGTHSLRTRLLAFDLAAATVAWLGLGFVLTQAVSPVEKLARGSLAAVAMLISLRAGGLYRSRVCVKLAQEIERISLAALVGTFVFVAAEWSFHGPSTQGALLCGLTCVTVTAVFRGHYRRWLSAQRARGRYLRNVILVGGNDDSTALWKMLTSEPELGFRVTAIIGGGDGRPWDHLPGSTTIAELPSLAKATGATGVLIASNALSGKDLQQAISLGSAFGLHVQVWPGLLGVGSVRLRDVPVSGEPFYYIEPHRTYRWQLCTKRAIDIAGSCAVLLLVSPVLALAALAIKIEDRGPVLHRQRRVGINGNAFTIYKLRTMAVGSEANADELQALNQRTDGPLYKTANDPRVTKVGRIFRLLSIDELPQLCNVFQGSMSLVGPRPALPHEALQFDEELQRRHTMRPGITGLWQARARENPSFNAYRRFDLHYIDNWSLRLDLSILAVTVPTVLAQAARGLRGSRVQVESADPTQDRARVLARLPNFPNIGDDLVDGLGEGLVQRELDPA